MEQRPIPISYDDEKSMVYNNYAGPYARAEDENDDENKTAYENYVKSPRQSEGLLDPNELAATLQAIEKIRTSLMIQSENMKPQIPLRSHTLPSSKIGSFHRDLATNSVAYTHTGVPQRPLPIVKQPSIADERETHFSEAQFLPSREPKRRSIWQRSIQTVGSATRPSSGMLFGPGGPATEIDPVFPAGDSTRNSKGSDPMVLHDYLFKLAKALMLYGAPGHRLERYLSMTAAALRANVDFAYSPDHMTMHIDDEKNHTGYTRLIKGAGTDLGRWLDVHNVSKHVISNRMTIEDGIHELREIASRKSEHSDWFLFFIYGLAGIGIAPFAYGARFVDLPLCFVLSAMLGVMQLKLAPRNHLYSVLFEVSAAITFSFLGRLLGSIRNLEGDRVFCYGAVSEAAINLLQPGYWITNACLELMNRQIATSGSRLMYALVYALLLAYGVAIGSSLYGLIDHDAVASTVCENQISPFWNLFFVPFFSAQVALLGGAKLSQLPAMVFISLCMYSAFFFSSRGARGSFTVGATVGGITMGLLGNGYARVGRRLEQFFENTFRKYPNRTEMDNSNTPDLEHTATSSTLGTKKGSLNSHIGYTCAAAAMVPAMIVLVPSGLANRGSHLAGILAAESVVRNTTGVPAFPGVNSEVFTAALPVYLNVVQIGLSISVGLSIGALAVYPFGKSRSGVMSW
jgi:uncharacterized membrane protein YjjP (DUF1212 family)